MQLFIEEDLARGAARDKKVYCDACEQPQPAAGAIRYGRYQVCNSCATEYELAQARGLTGSVGQFVRDRQFGERLDLLIEPEEDLELAR
jgi:hypothetical protein